MHHLKFVRSILLLAAVLAVAVNDRLHAKPLNAEPADAFVDSVGVNVHLHFDTLYSNFDLTKKALIDLRVRHVRDGLIDTTWQAYYDRHRALASEGIHGTYILPVPDPWNPYETRPDRILTVARALGPALEAFEGPNEYDQRHPETVKDWKSQLLQYQKKLYEVVKSDRASGGWSDKPVLGPSMGGTYNPATVHHPFSDGELFGTCDAGNFHPYSYGGNPFTWDLKYAGLDWYFGKGNHPSSVMDATQFHTALDVYAPPFGNRPMIATEAGYFTGKAAKAVSEAVQAKYIPRLLMEFGRAGVRRTFLYELLDERDKPDDLESCFGLVRHDGTYKPAFLALQGLIEKLIDAGPTFQTTPMALQLSFHPPVGYEKTEFVHYRLFEKRNGTHWLAIWHEIANGDVSDPTAGADPRKRPDVTGPVPDMAQPAMPTTLTLPPGIRSAQLHEYDAKGKWRSRPLSIIRGAIALDVPDQVVLIELK